MTTFEEQNKQVQILFADFKRKVLTIPGYGDRYLKLPPPATVARMNIVDAARYVDDIIPEVVSRQYNEFLRRNVLPSIKTLKISTIGNIAYIAIHSHDEEIRSIYRKFIKLSRSIMVLREINSNYDDECQNPAVISQNIYQNKS